MALSVKIGTITYRCVDDYAIRQQGGAVSTTTLHVLLGANPVPLVFQTAQILLGTTAFFLGIIQHIGTPEYSTKYESNIFAIEVSSLEALFNFRYVTKNFYTSSYATWTEVIQYLFTNYIAEENITLGAISTTAKTYDKRYKVKDKKLSDLLTEIVDAIGTASWWISADRKFYFQISTDFPEVVAPTHISEFKIEDDIGGMRTVQTVSGASTSISGTATNAALLATIAGRTGGSGKIEVCESDSQLHSDAKALTAATNKIADYGESEKVLTCLCHDLTKSALYNVWPIDITINGVEIVGDYVVVERTISHFDGTDLSIRVTLKNSNYFSRYGYSARRNAILTNKHEAVIAEEADNLELTPIDKKADRAAWLTVYDDPDGPISLEVV
jgi:hypothetical protein